MRCRELPRPAASQSRDAKYDARFGRTAMNGPSLANETKTPPSKMEKRLRIACVLALVALGLIVFSLIVPKPLPVIIAMSAAQAIGTLSLLIFLHVVSRDVWHFMGGKPATPTDISPNEQPPTA